MGINSTNKSHPNAKAIVNDLFTASLPVIPPPVAWRKMIRRPFFIVPETEKRRSLFKAETVHGKGASTVEAQLIKQCQSTFKKGESQWQNRK